MPPVNGPAGDSDAIQAYLFLCLDNGHYAASSNSAGSNLPRDTCTAGWQFIRSFALGVKEALPLSGDPEPALAGLRNSGYYIWPGGTLPVIESAQDN